MALSWGSVDSAAREVGSDMSGRPTEGPIAALYNRNRGQQAALRVIFCPTPDLWFLHRSLLRRRLGGFLSFSFTATDQAQRIRGIEGECADRSFPLACGLQSEIHAAIAGQFDDRDSGERVVTESLLDQLCPKTTSAPQCRFNAVSH
jgi:hypothetical protein